ncbi:hypothetical protein ABIC09_006780 [Bradyrhizobium sp. S3.12.5]|uniref:hypothetical protein n=1 Tax=Bradyrhizobium sp. S3.12.5 TaxID=3156386 RepID=UPI003398B1F4
MNEIIASGQQLTSLKLHWQFASRNARLEQAIADGSNGVAEDFYKEQGAYLRSLSTSKITSRSSSR